MEYNKTKRNLEKTAGIIGVLVSSIEILGFFIVMIICLLAANPWNAPIPGFAGASALIFVIPIGIVIANLILCAKAIKSPYLEDGSIKPRYGIRIGILILSFLDAQWLTFILIIIVLCMRDFVKANTTAGTRFKEGAHKAVENTKEIFGVKSESEKVLEQLLEIKKWKEAGLITEEDYNAKRKQILKI